MRQIEVKKGPADTGAKRKGLEGGGQMKFTTGKRMCKKMCNGLQIRGDNGVKSAPDVWLGWVVSRCTQITCMRHVSTYIDFGKF